LEQTLREQVKQLNLTDRITFLGAVAYERVPEIIASADIYVSPSVSECHPLTVIEAMAAGLPPVVVQSLAYLGTVEDGKNGLVCIPTVEGLAQGMDQLTNDPELREEFGAAARVSAGKYSIEHTADQVLEIYTEVLADWMRKPGG
jgi:glycosyltransferase involved in cell wall biosynthesis